MQITLNIYMYLKLEDAKDEVKRMEVEEEIKKEKNTLFAYQDMRKYAKIYQEKVLGQMLKKLEKPRKYKEKRGYTKICEIK